MKIAFVVLHYNVYEITKQCVDSIVQLNTDDELKVLIVDNASTNDSGKRLDDNYSADSKVELLFIEKGEGFSHANNIGYEFCKKQWNSDFIIMTNNDVIFEQQDFLKLMVKNYETNHYHVGGPDIFDLTSGFHINPFLYCLKNEKQILDTIENTKWKLEHLKKSYYQGKIQNLKIDIKKKIKSVLRMRQQKLPYDVSATGVDLSGACLIFSPDYVKSEFLPFFPETKFYYEESILFYQLAKRNMKSYYDADLHILHVGSVSTKTEHKQSMQRDKFVMERGLESLEVLLKLVKDAE